MATARQAADALDRAFGLAPRTSAHAATCLRNVGLLPSNQGVPAQATSKEIALLLTAVLVGSAANAMPHIVGDYAAMVAVDDDRRFGDAVADLIDRPDRFLELRIDVFAPLATLTFRGDDNGVRVVSYRSARIRPAPAFTREAVLQANEFTRLALAIRAAPAARVGPRRTSERFASIAA